MSDLVPARIKIRRDCTIQLPPEATEAMGVICGKDELEAAIDGNSVILKKAAK